MRACPSASGPLRPPPAGAGALPLAAQEARHICLARRSKFNYPDFRSLEELPDLGAATADNPRVVKAVETALGDDAELSQFGVLTWKGLPGSGVRLHYDYKPYRVVGCFLDWLFCIIPFTDCESTWLRGPTDRCFPTCAERLPLPARRDRWRG